MGVDAEYLYGYMAEVEDVEWDFELLREKFDLNKVVNKWSQDTYGDLINDLENDNVEDWYELADELGLNYRNTQYSGHFLYFTHFDVMKQFPDKNIKEFDELVKEFARQLGVKNPEVFTWNEFGYFD